MRARMTAVLLLPIAALPVRGFCRARLLPTAPVHHPRPPLLLKARQADRQSSRGTTRDFSRPPPSPELKAKQNKVASIVGVAYFSQFGVILAAALARLGLLKPPPFNSLTDIANAEMERAVAAGDVPPLMATAWAQRFWIGLVADYFAGYFAGGQDDAFLPQWCADHITLCASAGL